MNDTLVYNYYFYNDSFIKIEINYYYNDTIVPGIYFKNEKAFYGRGPAYKNYLTK